MGHGLSRSKLSTYCETDLGDRICGGFIGLAIGDALGLLVEGNSPEYCHSFVKGFKKIQNQLLEEKADRSAILQTFVQSQTGRESYGQISDDTQLARELLISLIDHPDWNLEDFGQRLGKLYSDHKLVGCGMGTAKSLTRLLKGAPPTESGCPVGSAGNSPAVRSTALGLFYHQHKQREIRIKAAIEQSSVTHRDYRCAAGAVVISSAVCLALQRPDISTLPHKHIFIDHLIEELTQSNVRKHEKVSAHLEELKDILKNNPKNTAPGIARMGIPKSYKGVDQGISGFVIPSVIWALYCFLYCDGDFVATLLTTIDAGGDTDSTAALSCCLSGAYCGMANIPQVLIDGVKDYANTDAVLWDAEQLVGLCKKIELPNVDE